MKKKTISKKILVALSTIGVASIVTPFVYACATKENDVSTNNKPLTNPVDNKNNSNAHDQPTNQNKPQDSDTATKPTNQSKPQGSDTTTSQSKPQDSDTATKPANPEPDKTQEKNPINQNPSTDQPNNQTNDSQPNQTQNDATQQNNNQLDDIGIPIQYDASLEPEVEINNTVVDEPNNNLLAFVSWQALKDNHQIEILFKTKKQQEYEIKLREEQRKKAEERRKQMQSNNADANKEVQQDSEVLNAIDLSKFKIIIDGDQELGFSSFRKENGFDIGTINVPANLSKIKIKSLKTDTGEIELLKSYQQKTFKFINDALGVVQFDLLRFSKTITNKNEIYPTDVKLEDIQVQATGTNVASYDYKVKKIFNFLDQKGKIIDNWLGSIGLVVEFTNKANKEEKIERVIYFDGFKHNPVDGTKVETPEIDPFFKRLVDEWDQDYVKFALLSNQEQYEKNNPWYINALKADLIFNKGVDIQKERSRIDLTKQKVVDQFNRKAKQIGLDSYESSFVKGFTLPVYDENNQFLGLDLYDKKEIGKASNRNDFIGLNQWQSQGLPRMLVNDHYKKIAMQTYSIEFTNPNGSNQSYGSAGTIWIMDFEKTNDGKYPTKWYFGTNLHVADALTSNTINAILTKISNKADLNKKFRPFNNDSSFERFYFNKNLLDKGLITKVFEAKDFLKSKPADFLVAEQATQYANLEDYADFTILEFDFSKVGNPEDIWALAANNTKNLDDEYEPYERDGEKLAKLITNDYANHPEVHISFKANSYLKNNEEIDKKLITSKKYLKEYNGDSLYALGFPGSKDDYFIRFDQDGDDEYSNRLETYSLWTNSDSRFYLNNPKDHPNDPDYAKAIVDQGNYLSSQLGYTNFTKKRGIVDAFLTINHVGDSFHRSGNDLLVQSGLNYLVKGYVPYGGASGSSFRNQNNELVGVFHSVENQAKVGLMAAFRSEGFDYQGLFGDKYNLPQYDLIYGGGKDQKNSYREAMKKIRPNQKTNLFPNGFDEIPQKYKFN